MSVDSNTPSVPIDRLALADALDLPPEMQPIQDAYWKARRRWTELQHAYLTVIEDMAGLHIDWEDDRGI